MSPTFCSVIDGDRVFAVILCQYGGTFNTLRIAHIYIHKTTETYWVVASLYFAGALCSGNVQKLIGHAVQSRLGDKE
jgi:hypothetical protein